MLDPAVSVVIPAHNEQGWIGRAVGSVLEESHPALEVIVVLDRCTDGTARVLDALADPRVRCLRNEGPAGIAGALNTGLRAARAPLIARLDADDVQERGRLALQVRHLRAHRLDVCCGWARVRRAGMAAIVQKTPERSAEIRRGLRRSNVIVHSTVLMKRQPVLELGGYRPTRWEDYDLWVRLAAAGATFGSVSAVVVTREHRADGYGERNRGLVGRLDTLAMRLRAAAATGGMPW